METKPSTQSSGLFDAKLPMDKVRRSVSNKMLTKVLSQDVQLCQYPISSTLSLDATDKLGFLKAYEIHVFFNKQRVFF